MRLYKNVDLCDLKAILEEGIKSLDASGNNNWQKGKRAPNSTDVVYLFSPKERNYFPNYGVVLLEVEVSDARPMELLVTDGNEGLYDEYVVDYVAPEKIKNIYIPKIFMESVKNYLDKEIFQRVTFVEITANYYGDSGKTEATDDILEIFAKTASIESAFEFNFFRGKIEVTKQIFGGEIKKREMLDLYDLNIIETP